MSSRSRVPRPRPQRRGADGAGAVAAAAERLRERAGEEPAVFLEKPRVRLEGDRVQPALDGDRVQPGGTADHRFLDGAEQLRDRGQVVSRCRTKAHAARESRVSARPSNVCNSTSGCGSASSPRRLIQTVRSPSLRGGRDVVEEARGRRGHGPRGPLRCARRTPASGRAPACTSRSRRRRRSGRTRPRCARARQRGSRGRCSRGRPAASRAYEPPRAPPAPRRTDPSRAATAPARPARRPARRVARARSPSLRDSSVRDPPAGSEARARGTREEARPPAQRRTAARARARCLRSSRSASRSSRTSPTPP